MIQTVADFLLELRNLEARRLAGVTITHGPTIGAMYEGLSRDLLERAIPSALGLRLVNGFVTDGLGNQSGQIDCMLVRGEGSQLPYTDSHLWHVKDVVAVLEIKKTLYGTELIDAFDHLRGVQVLHSTYMQSQRASGDSVDVSSALRAFAETTGIVPPAYEALGSLSVSDQLLFHTLVNEQVSPIRIVFGYDGFQTERGFRRSLFSRLQSIVAAGTDEGVRGYGAGSFPQLIVSGGYSLCKANGQPFSARFREDGWPFYFSASVNPLQLLLEYVWTRLSQQFGVGGLWGEDLTVEQLHPYLIAQIREQEGRLGWFYEFVDTGDAQLAAAGGYAEWEPAQLTDEGFVLVQRLCAGSQVLWDDPELLAFLASRGVDSAELKASLLDTGLVAMSGQEMELITELCQCVTMPDGTLVAGENNTGRLTRWVQRRSGQPAPSPPA